MSISEKQSQRQWKNGGLRIFAKGRQKALHVQSVKTIGGDPISKRETSSERYSSVKSQRKEVSEMAKSRGGKGGRPQYPANKPATTGNKSGGGRSNNTAKGDGKSSGGKGKK